MALLIEFFPVLLFFIAFKFYNIYVATTVGIVTTLIQVLLTRIWFKNWDKKQLVTLSVFLLFGGLTLYFHNPIFVKWKPTIIFWIFAVIMLATQFLARKPLIQRIMENMLEEKENIPKYIWKRLNMMWIIFFIIMGSVNLYIAYFYSDAAWVNFKFYGLTSFIILLSLLQTAFLAKYLTGTKQ